MGAWPPRRSCRGSRRCGATRRDRGRARQAPSSQRSPVHRATRRQRPSDHPQMALGGARVDRLGISLQRRGRVRTPTVRGRCRAGRATAKRSGKDGAASTRPATSSSRTGWRTATSGDRHVRLVELIDEPGPRDKGRALRWVQLRLEQVGRGPPIERRTFFTSSHLDQLPQPGRRQQYAKRSVRQVNIAFRHIGCRLCRRPIYGDDRDETLLTVARRSGRSVLLREIDCIAKGGRNGRRGRCDLRPQRWERR